MSSCYPYRRVQNFLHELCFGVYTQVWTTVAILFVVIACNLCSSMYLPYRSEMIISVIFFYNFWGLWMNVGFLTVEIRDIAVGLHCSYNMLSRVSSFLFYWALPIYIVSGDVWNHLTCFYLWLNCFLICHHSSRARTKWCEENKASEKIS